MIKYTKTLTGMLAGTVIALGLTTTAAQAQNAHYLSKNASHCEIFRGLSRDVPTECQTHAGRPTLRSFGRTRGFGPSRGLVVYDQEQSTKVAGADKTVDSDELSIAFRAEFEFDSHTLTDDAKEVIDRVAAVLKHEKMSDSVIQIEGHADARGKEDYNASLSDKRAQAVMDYLVDEHDIDPDRLEWTGKGESEPYDPANPDADVNRRVEFKNITG